MFRRKRIKGNDLFVSPDKKRKFKYNSYFRVKDTIREKVIAPVRNHPKYIVTRDFMINLVFLGVVLTFVMWCFSFNSPIRKGFGLAVTLALAEYYVKWYFIIRNKGNKK